MASTPIHSHPFLDNDYFTLIIKLHDTFDSSLALYYANHTGLITAHQLFKLVADSLRRRIKVDHFLSVLGINPHSYKLIDPQGASDYSPCYVGLFEGINVFTKSLHNRRVKFIEMLNQWIDTHQDLGYIKSMTVTELIDSHSTKPAVSMTKKIVKPKLSLKNDSSKFAFKERIASKETAKTGLSLIERIRLKEQQSKTHDQLETPEMKRNTYLAGKLVPVYNIISQMTGEQDKLATFPLTKLTHTIKDSLDYPIHTEEIHDVIKLLERKLTQGQVKDKSMVITTRNGLSVVKIQGLNREKDIKQLTQKQ